MIVPLSKTLSPMILYRRIIGERVFGALSASAWGSVRVMGRSGDEQVFFPRVANLAALADDPVAAWAVQQAEQLIREQQRRGATVMIARPTDEVAGWPVSRPMRFDEPLDPALDYLILNRVVGR